MEVCDKYLTMIYDKICKVIEDLEKIEKDLIVQKKIDFIFPIGELYFIKGFCTPAKDRQNKSVDD